MRRGSFIYEANGIAFDRGGRTGPISFRRIKLIAATTFRSLTLYVLMRITLGPADHFPIASQLSGEIAPSLALSCHRPFLRPSRWRVTPLAVPQRSDPGPHI